MNLQVLKGEVNQKKEVSGRLKLYKISKTVYERKNDQKRTFWGSVATSALQFLNKVRFVILPNAWQQNLK